MRYFLASLLLVTACIERSATQSAAREPSARQVAEQSEAISLEEAMAFPPVSTAATPSVQATQLASLRATDYVAELTQDNRRADSARLVERRRGGDWIATTWHTQSGGIATEYFNVDSAVQIYIFRAASGEITSARISQGVELERDPLVRTEETSRALGETCAIWRSAPSGPGVQRLSESCITEDGIALWSRRLSDARSIGRDLIVLGGATRATSVRRGHVDPASARPPPEAFEWAYWREHARNASAAGVGAAPDHDIWLEERRTREEGRVVAVRQHAGVRMEQEARWHQGGRSRRVSLYQSGLTLYFEDSAFRMRISGEAERVEARRGLEISLAANASQNPDRSVGGQLLVEPAPDVIVGRRCQWFDTMVGVTDGGQHVCRTADGFVLAWSRWSWGTGYRVTATRLNVPGSAEPIVPPPEVFAWAQALSR